MKKHLKRNWTVYTIGAFGGLISLEKPDYWWFYIINSNKDLKKMKKGSKEYLREIELEKSKMNIQRFKGLGEMNPEELWNTTLDPETRNLLQVQYSKDLKKDQSLIHTLMGSDVALRKDFIVSNAINVKNLDI